MFEKETYESSPQEDSTNTYTSGSNSTRTSLKTAAEAEAQREHARHTNPHGYSTTNTGVNVQGAEAEFAALQRELSGISNGSRRISRTQSRKEIHEKSEDIEKVASSDSTADGETFDLEGTLRGNHSVCYSYILFDRKHHMQLCKRVINQSRH